MTLGLKRDGVQGARPAAIIEGVDVHKGGSSAGAGILGRNGLKKRKMPLKKRRKIRQD